MPTSLARPSGAAGDSALAGALVLLGGAAADVRGRTGDRRPPRGGALTIVDGGRCGRVSPSAAAHGGGRVGVGRAPRARQRVDAHAVRRPPVSIVVH